MFCTKCGSELREQDNFCSACGVETARAVSARGTFASRRAPLLSRPMSEAKIAGVCAGFARYLGVDVTLVRVIWAALMLTGFGVVGYIAAWILMPKDPVSLAVQVRAN